MSEVSREEFNAVVAALEEERARNRRHRRMIEDLLFHLDESNMPTVSERIRALRRDALAFCQKEGDVTREASLTAAALTVTEKEGEDVCTATLTPRTLCIPAMRRDAVGAADGLYPIYIREDGTLTAVLV